MHSILHSQWLRHIGFLFLSAAILLFMALYNGYPIVTSDTGTYIESGFTLKPPLDRPIYYGLLLKVTSLGASLWLAIAFQSIVLAWVVRHFIRSFIPAVSEAHLLAFMVLLSLFTTCGWYVSQLMPDIYTAVLVGASILFLRKSVTGWRQALLLLLMLLSCLVHNSNMLLLFSYSILTLLAGFVVASWKVYRSAAIWLLAVSLVGWLGLALANFAGGKGFVTSQSTHVFLMGKLAENGVLKRYLDQRCPTKNWSICASKDNLPPYAWEFHWDAESPLQKSGGWEATRPEYNAILKDVYTTPGLYPMLAFKAVEGTFRQLTGYEIDTWYALPWNVIDEESPVWQAVNRHYTSELNELAGARTNGKTLDVLFFNKIFLLVAALSFMATLLFLKPEYKARYVHTLWLTGLFLVLNAGITANLSAVHSRFNSRVAWVVVLVNVIFLLKSQFGRRATLGNKD